MKQDYRLATLGAAAALVALTAGILTASPAVAGPSTSPFDPPVAQTSTNNNGALDTLEFYNATGARIFGGALATPPKFIKATNYTGRTSADTLATTFIATPVKGSAAVTWQTQQVSAGDAYRTAAVTGQASDGKALNSSTFSWLLPADINILNVNADPAWADLYQIRLSTSGPGAGIDFTKFPSATVSVDNAAGTWKQIFPAQVAQATTTIVTASPASPTNAGTSVTLSAAVAPAAAAGSVEFKDGATSLGT